MSSVWIHHGIDARPRSSAPPARAVMPVFRAAPGMAPGGVYALGGLAFGGTGPEAAT